MKTLVGVLLTTIVLAAGYREADAHSCKTKHVKHTRCACHSRKNESDVINAQSYGGYLPPENGTLDNGGSPLMPNSEQLNPSDTMRMMDDQLNNNNNSRDLETPIMDNGWHNSGRDCKNK